MTKVYNKQDEIDADIIDGVLNVKDHIKITFDCVIKGNIIAGDIYAQNIKSWSIDAFNIDAQNITSWDISAHNINAHNINACDINACDINACDINACDINACDINVRNIVYRAVCCAYSSFKCKSVVGRRKNAKHFCLDREIEIIGDQND